MLHIIKHGIEGLNLILASTESGVVYFVYENIDKMKRGDCIRSFSSRKEAISFLRGVHWMILKEKNESDLQDQTE